MTTHADTPRLVPPPGATCPGDGDGDGPQLLDVRTPGQFRATHIFGSYNVPLDTFSENRAELPNPRILDGGILAQENAGRPRASGEQSGLARRCFLYPAGY